MGKGCKGLKGPASESVAHRLSCSGAGLLQALQDRVKRPGQRFAE